MVGPWQPIPQMVIQRNRNPVVSLGGYRITCSVDNKAALVACLEERRKERLTWTDTAWQHVMQEVKAMDWGVLSCGGVRMHGTCVGVCNGAGRDDMSMTNGCYL